MKPILKYLFANIATVLIFFSAVSCDELTKDKTPPSTDFSGKVVNNIPNKDSLEMGKTYLSVYSQIYSFSEQSQHNLTATVSMRNIDEEHDIYISRADYYDSHGNIINSYLIEPIQIKPLETLEIVIKEIDEAGGTGANFIFEWHHEKNAPEPWFEAVMISTLGQQGLSFTTTGKRIE